MTPLDDAMWRSGLQRAEDAGFSTVLFSDHFERSPLGPIPAMAAASMLTSRLHVGSLVLNNDFRHPALLAKEVLTLAWLAPGRVEIGLGAGWMDQDYEQSGIVREAPGSRVDRLGESIDILKSQLAGDVTDHDGKAYQVRGMPAVPAAGPNAKRVPILIGGTGPRMLRLAAEKADIVSVNWDVRSGSVGPAALASGLAASTDDKIALVRAAAGDRLGDLELHVQCYLFSITDRPLDAVEAWAATWGSDVDPMTLMASPHVLVGSVEGICEQLLARRERWGFSYVSVYDRDIEAAAEVIARLPRV